MEQKFQNFFAFRVVLERDDLEIMGVVRRLLKRACVYKNF